MLLLSILSIIVAGAIVLLVAGYLIAIGWALTKARQNVVRLADTLEEIAARSEPLGGKIAPVGAEITALAEQTKVASDAVNAAVDAIETERRSTTGA